MKVIKVIRMMKTVENTSNILKKRFFVFVYQ